MGESGWNAALDTKLQEALEQVPAGTNDRWVKIASIVGSKSAKQCKNRAQAAVRSKAAEERRRKSDKTDEDARTQLDLALAAALEQAAALSALREKVANGASIDDINRDLYTILAPKHNARPDGGGDPDELDGYEAEAKPEDESASGERDDAGGMEEPSPAEGEVPEEMLVTGMSRNVKGSRGYIGIGSLMSMGMEVLDVYPSGMVLRDGAVGYINNMEGGEAYVNYYFGGTGCYTGIVPADYHSVKLLKKLETHGIDGTAHLVHSMMELEKCKEELKNTRNELSRWQSGAVKSIEVYDVDKEVSTYDIAGPSARREACASLSSMQAILQTTNTLVEVKKEKIAAVCQLAVALEDLEDTQETLGQQAVFTDAWQGRFDELAFLAEAAGVDKVQIQAVRHRSVSGKKRARYE